MVFFFRVRLFSDDECLTEAASLETSGFEKLMFLSNLMWARGSNNSEIWIMKVIRKQSTTMNLF